MTVNKIKSFYPSAVETEDPLRELLDICHTRDTDDFFQPYKNRTQMLNVWIEKWLVPVEKSLSVINTDALESEFSDAVKYKLITEMQDDIMEECAQITQNDHKIGAKVVCLRRILKRK